jgi:hypothetical protein
MSCKSGPATREDPLSGSGSTPTRDTRDSIRSRAGADSLKIRAGLLQAPSDQLRHEQGS